MNLTVRQPASNRPAIADAFAIEFFASLKGNVTPDWYAGDVAEGDSFDVRAAFDTDTEARYFALVCLGRSDVTAVLYRAPTADSSASVTFNVKPKERR